MALQMTVEQASEPILSSDPQWRFAARLLRSLGETDALNACRANMWMGTARLIRWLVDHPMGDPHLAD